MYRQRGGARQKTSCASGAAGLLAHVKEAYAKAEAFNDGLPLPSPRWWEGPNKQLLALRHDYRRIDLCDRGGRQGDLDLLL